MTDKVDIPNIALLDSKALKELKKVSKKQENGEELDHRTIEALRAINIASNTIDSIMSGRQIDMVFFQKTSADIIMRINGPPKSEPKKKIKKKRKLYFKDKN